MWLVLLGRCWTSERLQRHGLPNRGNCTLCSQESLRHFSTYSLTVFLSGKHGLGSKRIWVTIPEPAAILRIFLGRLVASSKKVNLEASTSNLWFPRHPNHLDDLEGTNAQVLIRGQSLRPVQFVNGIKEEAGRELSWSFHLLFAVLGAVASSVAWVVVVWWFLSLFLSFSLSFTS
jgi:hypothetical protein